MEDLSRRTMVGALTSGHVLLAQSRGAVPAAATAGARVHNVRDYGAKGDGATVDTAAVQSAIDACTRDKGGIVLVPAGEFVIGTVELKSHVTLYLAASAKLVGSAKPESYSAGKGVPPGNGNIVMLYAVDADNVTIEGPGTIDGQGLKFNIGRGDNTGPGQNSAQGYFNRPHLMIFYRCRNLRMRDVFLTASAYHCVRILDCRHVQLDAVRIHNRVNRNNDGFHIVSSEYVSISNCNIQCQDDACALFGSNRFITVTNCIFSTRWSVFRFGGGRPENIAISNCVIYDTFGCPIKMRFGPGTGIQNASFSNLVMTNVTGPISIGLDSNSRRPSGQTGAASRSYVRNLRFSGIRATVATQGHQYADMAFEQTYRPGETRTCITLNGAQEGDVLEDISFTDVQVRFGGGGTAEEAARRDVPKMAGEYFELGTLPAYGMFARNVRGLSLQNVRFEVDAPDLRPAIVFERVEDASVVGFGAHGNAAGESLVRMIDSRDVMLSACRALTPSPAFVQLEGQACANITIDGGDLSKVTAAAVFGRGGLKDAVRVRG